MAQNEEETAQLEASPEIATFFQRAALLPAHLVHFVASGRSVEERIKNAIVANEAMKPLLLIFADQNPCPEGCVPNKVTGGCDCDGSGPIGIASAFTKAPKASAKKKPAAKKKKAAKGKKK